ncbi:flavin reductase family protein [Phytoactinopolyspora halotolerans]|uniref:Flavin reductase family protein n=1 Tax=Phytoactinopolyspora halotolerans TaxID=1981512 RepID=A0A6L9S6B8_9ACTN|nr:flavin reductase family protein [Phytoactinopolyspora halotolerans]NEE00072.1 flavin reductase family protein [Phytoactinopolyspora halotolerans]
MVEKVPAGVSAVPYRGRGERAPEFRDAMARLGGGVAVLSVLDPVGRDCGLTVTAVSSVSLEPALVLVCVKKDGFIHDALFVADGWSLTFLAVGQVDAAHYFSRSRYPGDRDDFSTWDYRRAHAGEPVLTGGVAAVECEPHELVDAGDHTIALGRVVRVTPGMTGSAPLLHVDRAYIAPGPIVDGTTDASDASEQSRSA